MSKVTFYYGVMKSGKTGQLLITKKNYEIKGDSVTLIKPASDTRSDKVSSRIGMEATPNLIIPDRNSYDGNIEGKWEKEVFDIMALNNDILVDEAQFFDPGFIKLLTANAKEFDLNVIAYGLLKDFNNELFDGSREWIENADSLREIRTLCDVPGCGLKAVYNVLDDNKVHKDNHVIGDDQYNVRCFYHKDF